MMFLTKKLLVASTLSSMLALSGCSWNDKDSAKVAPNTTGDNPVKVFDKPMPTITQLPTPKIITLASASESTASLVWQPSLDSETTLDSSAQYNVHASTEPNFIPTSKNIIQSNLTNKRLVIANLEPNKTYYMRVTVNKGQDNTMSEPHKVTISNANIKLAKNVTVVQTSQIKTNVNTMQNSKIQLNKADNLKTGNIIVNSETGEAIKITAVDGKNVATVASANLADVFEQVHIQVNTRVNWE